MLGHFQSCQRYLTNQILCESTLKANILNQIKEAKSIRDKNRCKITMMLIANITSLDQEKIINKDKKYCQSQGSVM